MAAIHSRLLQKHDVEANWLKAVNFTPMIGEIIVYDPDETYDYSRYKIGDGVSNVNDLAFQLEIITLQDIDDICTAIIEPVTISADEDGNVVLGNVSFSEYGEDEVTLNEVSFVAQSDGSILLK